MPSPIDAEREGVRIGGFAGLPTYNRANSAMQFLVVNGRPVRDKLLIGAVRGAYADYLARDRYPALALFLDCDPAFVDVNVHPAKTEVRFRDAGLVRGLIVSSLKAALHEAGHRASTTVSGEALAALRASSPADIVHHSASRTLNDPAARVSSAAVSGPRTRKLPRRVWSRTRMLRLPEHLPLGRGARAASRKLHRGADRKRHRHRRSARRA